MGHFLPQAPLGKSLCGCSIGSSPTFQNGRAASPGPQSQCLLVLHKAFNATAISLVPFEASAHSTMKSTSTVALEAST